MIDDSKHSREAYRVEQSLAARHYEKEIEQLKADLKLAVKYFNCLDNCKTKTHSELVKCSCGADETLSQIKSKVE